MHKALLSVGFGSLITLSQILILYQILELNIYIEYRAIINTMNIAGPLLCFGFDNASYLLRKETPHHYFIWNSIFIYIILCLVFSLSALFLFDNQKLQSITLGIASGVGIAGTIIVANHYRSQGDFSKYFYFLNINDKIVRFIIIITLAFFIQNLIYWGVLVALLGMIYTFVSARKTRIPIKINLEIFLIHFKLSFPFIFSSIGLIFLTRMPFYSAYFSSEDNGFISKIDFSLLFALFALIPSLNNMKIIESQTVDIRKDFLYLYKKNKLKIFFQEVFIGTGILLISIFAVKLKVITIYDIKSIVLPILIGMFILSSFPNYVQLIMLQKKFYKGIITACLLVLISIVTYLPILNEPTQIPIYFIFSSILYLIVGFATYGNNMKYEYFRWKSLITLIATSIAATELVIIIDSYLQ